MRSLKSLVENKDQVWLYCGTLELQKSFLEQAEKEGFSALNGQKPTELFPSKFYGISRDMTMGYVSAMCWVMSDKKPGHVIAVPSGERVTPVKVDYGEYVSGASDYMYQA
ncbi:MAG: hypothetical protein IJU59_05825 [Firmicutes bacterium]|nr:hypothetical protein [Bacillota bacterium]